MNLNQSIPVIGEDFFRLTYIENTGIVFGLPFGGRIFLVIFTLAAIVVLIYYILKIRQGAVMPLIALSLILGGAFGNLIDRLFRGKVVDFLDFDFPDFIMTRWPVFNLADSAVSTGMTLLVVYLLFFEPKVKMRSAEADDATAAARNDISGSGETTQGADRPVSGR